jgi:hypothetical protein
LHPKLDLSVEIAGALREPATGQFGDVGDDARRASSRND